MYTCKKKGVQRRYVDFLSDALVNKRIEKKENEVQQLGLHTFPLLGISCFILEFVFDFGKYNLVILEMTYLFPYLRPILIDFWKDNLMILK